MHWSVTINKALVTWGMLAQMQKGNAQMCVCEARTKHIYIYKGRFNAWLKIDLKCPFSMQ